MSDLGRLLDDGMRVVLEPELKADDVDHRRRNGAGAAELSRRADSRVHARGRSIRQIIRPRQP